MGQTADMRITGMRVTNLRAQVYKNEDTCICGCFLLMPGEREGDAGRKRSVKGRQRSVEVGEREAKKQLESEKVQ
ncbi:hypothetical protein BHK98_04570 [Hornefia porci]|uniref:Uncharacterized protein n=1 Tax=Hornefia porci TaxID=2652292 RepID=A0A1Q9JGT6_9FIRM|nr:hypothetical protein BHK98_04570 [Hornefia porci]